MKYCKKCNTETERYASGNCKPCQRVASSKYYQANSIKLKNYRLAYYSSNREKVLAYGFTYRAINPEKVRSIDYTWRAVNREKYLEYQSKYQKKYYANHPGLSRIKGQNRRARIRENGGKLSPGLDAKLFKLQRGKCACCGQPLGSDYHLDHIIPLALGGSNTNDNIQLLRAKCNNQKRAKHPVDFMQERGFLL